MDDIQKGTYHALSFEVHGKLLALNKISLLTPKLQKAFAVNSSSSNVFLLPSWNINILSSCHTMGGCFTSSHNLRWCGILNRKTRNQAEAREISLFPSSLIFSVSSTHFSLEETGWWLWECQEDLIDFIRAPP